MTYLFRDPRWVRGLGIAALLGLPAATLNLLGATVLADRSPIDDPVRSALLGWSAGRGAV